MDLDFSHSIRKFSAKIWIVVWFTPFELHGIQHAMPEIPSMIAMPPGFCLAKRNPHVYQYAKFCDLEG
jgi:hypothetical protein